MANSTSSSKARQEIRLYATEIGSILGLNPYCSRLDVIKRVWERIDKDGIPDTCRPPLDFLKAIGLTKSGREFRRQKYSIKDHARFDELVARLKTSLSDDGRTELVDMARGFVRTEMGKNSEMLAIDIAEANPCIGKCSSTQRTYERLAWSSSDEQVEVVILGRIDCLDETDRVVEIKTRFGRKPNVSPTEFAQLQTYLFLAQKQQGYVIELFEGEKLFINLPLAFDKAWWINEVIPALASFANDLISSMAEKTLVSSSDDEFH